MLFACVDTFYLSAAKISGTLQTWDTCQFWIVLSLCSYILLVSNKGLASLNHSGAPQINLLFSAHGFSNISGAPQINLSCSARAF